MQSIAAVLATMTECARARDVDGLLSLYHPSARAFDFGAGDAGIAQIRAHCEQGYAGIDDDGGFSYTFTVERLIERGNVACCFGVERVAGRHNGSAFHVAALATYVFERFDGRWLIVHQHLSTPQQGDHP